VSEGKRIGGWVAISAGAVAVGVGVAFGIVTLGLASDVATGCMGGTCPTQGLIDKNASAHTDAILADILIPVGVVAVGIGTWLVATASHHPKASASGALRVAPFVSPGAGGIAAFGRF
jgi:hypothetical protein